MTVFKELLSVAASVFVNFFPIFEGISYCNKTIEFAILVVVNLCLLRYSPQQKSYWLCRQQLYVTQFFLSVLCYISSFWNLKICSYLFFSVLFSTLYLFILLLSSLLLSVSCSVLSLSVYLIYFLISLIILFSNLLSFRFSFPITLFCLLIPYVLLLFNLISFCYS